MSTRRLARAGALALSLSLALSACDAPSPLPPRAQAQASGSDARSLVAGGATLLDVRTPGEYADGHVEGALNVPVDQVGARLAEIPRDQPVVVYCRSGARSARAASTLREAGYEVHDIGPMSAW